MCMGFTSGEAAASAGSLQFVNEGNDLSNSGDLGGILFWDFAVEFLLDGHDQFNGIKRVGLKIINELGLWDNLGHINTKLLSDQFLDLVVVQGHRLTGIGGDGDESRSSGNKKGDDSLLEHGGILRY